MWNILTDNLSTEYRTDLRIGKVDELLVAYNFLNSWLSLLSSFDFIVSLRRSENQQYSYYFIVLILLISPSFFSTLLSKNLTGGLNESES